MVTGTANCFMNSLMLFKRVIISDPTVQFGAEAYLKTSRVTGGRRRESRESKGEEGKAGGGKPRCFNHV